MIDAREVLQRIKLPGPDEAEVRRLGEEIVAAVKRPEFDGSPFSVRIPAGVDGEQQARSQRIVGALQRRFQEKYWIVQVEPVADGFGQVEAYNLWFAIDPSAGREVRVKADDSTTTRRAPGRFLQSLHEELSEALGVVPEQPSAKSLPKAPDVSVLLGTYNRLPLLKAAVASVRASVGALSYEIVVVDGGSTDGSRAWLAAQPDVLLLGERRLEGAVRAFNQAYALSRGTFICNLNDDVTLEGRALEEGVKYLQDHPEAGQVAFSLRGDGEEWVINDVYPGRPGTTYANHGVARRTVADAVVRICGGLWPPCYETYGGDCEFSAWVWRLGHQVAKLPHLRVLDARPDDALREKNRGRFGADTKRMYARWPSAAFRPDGPEPRVTEAEVERYRRERDIAGAQEVLAAIPGASADDALEVITEIAGLPEPREERRLRAIAPRVRALDPRGGRLPPRDEDVPRERVLHVHINGESAVDQQDGLVRALREVGKEAYAMVRWPDYQHEARQARILDEARRINPTLVFMQLQAPAVEAETIKELRKIVPEAVIVTWCGDIAEINSPWNTEWQVRVGRLADLTLHSSMTHVRALRAAGIHSAGYLQIGYDEEQYRPSSAVSVEHDVAFLGSRYGVGDAFSSIYNWKSGAPAHDAKLRDDVVERMRELFPNNFALHGSGWDNNMGAHKASCEDIYARPCSCGGKYDDIVYPVPVTHSHEVYLKSKIGLSISLDNKLECYTSDRLFRILGCGAMLLVKRFPGMASLGLVDGENCLAFDDAEEAGRAAKYAVDREVERLAIAAAGQKLAVENHTWGVRMLELGPYLRAVRIARGT